MADQTITPTSEATAGHAESKLSAIIFDLDGVLVNSAPCHRDAFIEVLRPLGIENFDYSRFAGWRTRDVVVFVLAEAGIAATGELIDSASTRKSKRARDLMAATHPVVDGAVEMLHRLRDRGFQLALASSGSRESVGMFLDSTATRPLFLSVLTGGDVVHAKPNPEIYTRTFQRLGLSPSEGLIVEDAVAGVHAARDAGSRAVGVAGSCRAEDLREAGALDVLDAVATLPQWLEYWLGTVPNRQLPKNKNQ